MKQSPKQTIATLCLVGMLPVFLFAQSTNRSKVTLRADAQLPRMLVNRAFTKAFSGVVNGGLSINLGGKHISSGALYRFTQYQVFPKTNVDAHPVLTIHTAAFKLSYDRLTQSEKGMWSPFVEPGYSFLKYTKITPTTHDAYETQSQGFSLNLGTTYYIMMNDWTGVGFTLGYNMIDYVYRPENVCMDGWGLTYTDSDKQGSFKNIFFGFSVYFDFAYKAETAEE